MKHKLLTAIASLLPGLLFCLALSVPAQAGSFSVTLTKATPQLNTSVTSGPGQWRFVITVTGRVSFLGLNIKNNPGAGDICWHSGIRQPKGTFEVDSSPIVAATTQACGKQFTDWDGPALDLFSYIDTSDDHASVVVTVTYPDPTP